jgi:polysaccharide deacetylase 2 family uncharacterized protein YibQ
VYTLRQSGVTTGGSSMVALRWFWRVLLLLAASGAAVLQILGPPPGATRGADDASHADDRQAIAARADGGRNVSGWKGPPLIPRGPTGTPIPAPEPALVEAAPDFPGARLPRVATDGRLPMQVYAGGFDPSDARPRIALLVGGIGLSETESEDAVRTTPPAVSLAVSPYSALAGKLLDMARARGHEVLISIPMEPQGYPMQDAGPHSLLTTATPAANARNLEWVLSRIAGYVGATGAMNGLHGERFVGVPEQMVPVLQQLADRGLLYIGARPTDVGDSEQTQVAMRAADLIIDATPVRVEIEHKLSRLEEVARERGSALGLADLPASVTVDRIAAWAAALDRRGFVLTPVSAVVQSNFAPTARAKL